MRPKVALAALVAMAALGGWATTDAAYRDGYYSNGYYYYSPDRSYTYYYYPERSYTYYYHPDRSYTYYYGDPYYSGYGDPHRNYLNEYSWNSADPYGIENHDTN